jgi:hypothetical protein
VSELLLDLQSELTELAAIESESIGWLPLGDGVYLHWDDPEALVITVVGVPEAGISVVLGGRKSATEVASNGVALPELR